MTTNVVPFARTADQDITISSLEIAELTGKRHGDVMRDIRKILKELGKGVDAFLRQRLDGQGKTVPLFALDRFHTEVLVTGYDIKRRAAVIQRWYDLESGNWYDGAEMHGPFSDGPGWAYRRTSHFLKSRQNGRLKSEPTSGQTRRAAAFFALTAPYWLAGRTSGAAQARERLADISPKGEVGERGCLEGWRIAGA